MKVLRSPLRSLNFAHPDPQLQIAWNAAQFGILVLPFSAFLGAIALILATILTGQKCGSQILQSRLNQGFAILGIWMAIASIFAHNPGDAFLGLFNFLPYFWIFTGLSALIQTPAQLRQIAWLVLLGSLPVTLIGFGQLFFGWGGHPQFLWVLIDWEILPGGNPTGRMASVFLYANFLATYLIVVLIFGLGLWITPRLTNRKTQGIQSKLFLTVAIALVLAALILTNSRNAWAIVVLAAIAFAIYQGWKGLVAGVVAMVSAVVAAAFGPKPLQILLRPIIPAYFWARLNDQLYPDRPYALLRTTQWQFAWSLTQQRPWLGWGLRNFNPLYEQQMQVWLGHPHNLPLMLLCETGIPATLLFYSLVGWILLRGCRFFLHWPFSTNSAADRLIFFTYLVAFLALTIFSLFDVTLFDLRVNTLGWIVLAGICGVSESVSSPRD